MIGNVGDLVGKQARIDRVQHGARTGHGIVRFQMPVAIPGQGGDPVAHADTEAMQGVRQPARALVAIAVGIAVHIALDPPRNDFAAPIMTRCKLDNAGNQQGLIHHLAHHWTQGECRHRASWVGYSVIVGI
ncbi:hypothetical protein D3C81_1474510 [compost metagenome]